MTEGRLKRFLLYALSAAAAAALFYVALRYLLVWLLPFLIAAAAAAAMEPAIRFLQARLRFRRGFSSLLLTLFLLFLLGGLLSLLGTTLTGEAYALLERAPELLAEAPSALASLLARLERYTAACPPWLRETIAETLSRYVVEAGDLLSGLVDRLVSSLGALAARLPALALSIATCVLAIYFTSSEWPMLRRMLQERLSAGALQKLRILRSGAADSLSRWLRAELTLCAVTFAELLAGFFLLRQPYALLLAFLITLVDALPVFGTGTVLVPWAVIELLFGSTPKALALAALYAVTLTVRNVLEPRLLGAQAGLPPIASLLAMYLGFCSFGVGGMVLFPFLLLLAAQLRRQAK